MGSCAYNMIFMAAALCVFVHHWLSGINIPIFEY